MATLRPPLFFLLLLSLLFTQITSHAPPETVEDHSSELGDSADLKHELDRLKSQISFLESMIKERSHASSNKDENIRDSEVLIREKSDSMQPLENGIEYLQHEASVDGKKETSNSHASASELEKQVHGGWLPHRLAVHVYHFQSYMASRWNESWRSALDITIQKVLGKKDQLKSWAVPQIRDVETHFIPRMKDNWSKFINHLEPHLQSLLPKTIDVFDSSKRSLMPHLVKARTVMGHYIQSLLPKTIDVFDSSKRSLMPHLVKARTVMGHYIQHFIPRMKDNWSKSMNHLESHLQSLLPKTIDVFDSSKRSLMPHLVKARTVTGHYIQEVKKFSRPYINHFVMVTSRYETMQAAFEPYINKTINAYRKLIKSASIYHHQSSTEEYLVKRSQCFLISQVQETLKSHELTRPLAAWFPGNDKQKGKDTH